MGKTGRHAIRRYLKHIEITNKIIYLAIFHQDIFLLILVNKYVGGNKILLFVHLRREEIIIGITKGPSFWRITVIRLICV